MYKNKKLIIFLLYVHNEPESVNIFFRIYIFSQNNYFHLYAMIIYCIIKLFFQYIKIISYIFNK